MSPYEEGHFQTSVSTDELRGPAAAGDDPIVKIVKDQMNGTPKRVFSTTLKRVEWQNSRLATRSLADEVASLSEFQVTACSGWAEATLPRRSSSRG